MQLDQRCFLTGAGSPWVTIEYLPEERLYVVTSELCGTYRVALDLCGPEPDRPQLFSVLQAKYGERLHVLAGISLRESEDGNTIMLRRDTVEDLMVSKRLPQGPLEQIDEILRFLYRQEKARPGQYVRLYTHPLWRDMKYPIAYAHDAGEFVWLLGRALEMGYLEVSEPAGGAEPPRDVRLTVDGYRRMEALLEERDLSQAFVAMSFQDELDKAWHDGIEPALRATGWIPLYLKETQHNDKIDDLIVTEIRRSGLVIADFTLHRQNVYFEAGFAMGLGIPVIWTIRSGAEDSAHFDTRQYNHVLWDTPEDLRTKLELRIRASLPTDGRNPTESSAATHR